MKRIALAVAGFVTGYAYAFVSCLAASKGLTLRKRKSGPHPPGTCAEDCPWPHGVAYVPSPGTPERIPNLAPRGPERTAAINRALDGTDMHDVLPTDDELDVPEFMQRHDSGQAVDWKPGGFIGPVPWDPGV